MNKLLMVTALLVLPTAALAKKPAALDPDDPTELQVEQDIKVVFHATHDVWKQGTPKTLWYLDRLVHKAYPDKLGVPATELDFKVVAHDAPVYGFLDDAGWSSSTKKHAAAPLDHNPHKDLIAGLIEAGVDLEVCEVTLASHGYTREMLLPGIKVAPAGLPRVIDLQLMGYTRLVLE